jgi:hypothetical protein
MSINHYKLVFIKDEFYDFDKMAKEKNIEY